MGSRNLVWCGMTFTQTGSNRFGETHEKHNQQAEAVAADS